MSTIGFVGLGNMGVHMARNLLRGGHKLVIFDLLPKPVQQLQSEGATPASCPAEVAEKTRCLVTMLPSTPQVMDVYTGKDGIFKTLQADSLCIDSSTIDPAGAREVACMTSGKESFYLDAPVSGGVVAAQNAALTFMVGGDEKAFDTAHPLLSLMGKNIVHCGLAGTGQAAKICNNLLLGISMIGTAEVMNLGQKLGLDAELLARILNSSTGRCWSSEVYNPVPGIVPSVPSSNDYKGGFGNKLMAKDLGLAQNAATESRSPTPLGSLAHQFYRILAESDEFGAKDFSSVYQFLKKCNK